MLSSGCQRLARSSFAVWNSWHHVARLAVQQPLDAKKMAGESCLAGETHCDECASGDPGLTGVSTDLVACPAAEPGQRPCGHERILVV